MDYYLDDENCVERLFNEWKEHNSLIVAYDYDNTVFDYHEKGREFDDVVKLLQQCEQMGFHLIVFTSCDDERFVEIGNFLEQNGIPYHAINETPDFIPFKGRKVYYNILLDDRAGLSAAFRQLTATIYYIKGYKASRNMDGVA